MSHLITTNMHCELEACKAINYAYRTTRIQCQLPMFSKGMAVPGFTDRTAAHPPTTAAADFRVHFLATPPPFQPCFVFLSLPHSYAEYVAGNLGMVSQIGATAICIKLIIRSL